MVFGCWPCDERKNKWWLEVQHPRPLARNSGAEGGDCNKGGCQGWWTLCGLARATNVAIFCLSRKLLEWDTTTATAGAGKDDFLRLLGVQAVERRFYMMA